MKLRDVRHFYVYFSQSAEKSVEKLCTRLKRLSDDEEPGASYLMPPAQLDKTNHIKSLRRTQSRVIRSLSVSAPVQVRSPAAATGSADWLAGLGGWGFSSSALGVHDEGLEVGLQLRHQRVHEVLDGGSSLQHPCWGGHRAAGFRERVQSANICLLFPPPHISPRTHRETETRHAKWNVSHIPLALFHMSTWDGAHRFKQSLHKNAGKNP